MYMQAARGRDHFQNICQTWINSKEASSASASSSVSPSLAAAEAAAAAAPEDESAGCAKLLTSARQLESTGAAAASAERVEPASLCESASRFRKERVESARQFLGRASLFPESRAGSLAPSRSLSFSLALSRRRRRRPFCSYSKAFRERAERRSGSRNLEP